MSGVTVSTTKLVVLQHRLEEIRDRAKRESRIRDARAAQRLIEDIDRMFEEHAVKPNQPTRGVAR